MPRSFVSRASLVLLVAQVAISLASVVPPSFQYGFGTIVVDENSGSHAIPWAVSIDAGSTSAVAHTALGFQLVWANTSRSSLFSVQPTVSTAGVVSFTPALNENTHGITCATFVQLTAQGPAGTVRSCNPISSCPVLHFVINRVNRAPSATLSQAIVTVTENFGGLLAPSSPLSWSGIVIGSSHAGAGDTNQSVTYLTSTANPSLFAAVPVVHSNGTLAFELAAYQSGTSTVTITPQDDGAPPRTGPILTLSVVVLPVNQPPQAVLAISPTLTVGRTAGAVHYAAFLTDVRPAAVVAGESSQQVAVSLASTPVGAFSDIRSTVSGTVASLDFAVTPSFWGTANVTVHVRDDGGTSNGGSDSLWLNFSVDVPFTNAAPTITVPSALGIGDNDPRRTVGANETAVIVTLFATGMSAGPGEDPTQTFTVSTSTDSPGSFTAQPSLSTLGTLTFSYSNGHEGSHTLSFNVTDNFGLSTTAMTVLTISRANRCPTMTIGSAIPIAEDSGRVVWPSWITGISPGPAEEANQTVTFNVTTSQPDAFVLAPIVSYNPAAASANVSFELDGLFFGTISVTIRLTDSGSAVVGCNSIDSTFSLAVTAINDPPRFTVMLPNISVSESAGLVRVPGWASGISPGDAGEFNQSLSFRIEYITGSVGDFDSPIAVNASTGDLTFAAKAQVNTVLGDVLFRAVLVDNLGAESCVANVTCAVYRLAIDTNNTAATASIGADVLVWEDRRDVFPTPANVSYVQSNWATAISVGPVRERTVEGQTAVFVLTSNASAMFTQIPAVDSAGSLSFSLVPHANGVAHVAVSITDSGPNAPVVALGSFHIHVLPINDAPFVDRNSSNVPVPLHLNTSVTAPMAFQLGVAYPGPPGANDEMSQALSVRNCSVQPPELSRRCDVAIAPDGTLSMVFERYGLVTGGQIEVALADNGGTDRGGTNSSTFTIPLAVQDYNDPPSFTLDGVAFTTLQQSVAAVVSVAGWAKHITPHPTEEATQTVAMTATNNNAGLFAVPPAVNALGTLTFTPAQYAVGTADVTVTATDNGVPPRSASQMFQIIVRSVNQCPTFKKGGTITVDQQSVVNTTTIPGFLYDVWKGPPNEAAQTLQFSVVSSDPSLFSVPPTIALSTSDPTKADLSFAPRPFANGLATITVTVKDNGGLADGGCDTSTAQSFYIRVNYVNVPPSFACGSAVVVDENAGAVSIPGWAGSIDRGSQSESSQSLFFYVTPHNSSHYAMFLSQPSISALDGALTFQTRADVNTFATGPLLFRIVLYDNGRVGGGWEPSCTGYADCCNISITVRPVNHPPTFVKGPDITVSEDLVNLNPVPVGNRYCHEAWATNIYIGTPSEVNDQLQTGSFTTTVTNTALFSATPVVHPNGTLCFTLAPHRSGSARVTVVLRDTGASPNASPEQLFDINVLPVNEAPVGTLSRTSFTVAENSGAATFTNLFSTKAPAPAAVPDEGSQTLTTSIVILNGTELFAVAPSVSGDTLTFTPAANKHGVARVLIRLKDNGGTANGGTDTTDLEAFIVVEHVNQVPSLELRLTYVQAVAGRGLEQHGTFIANVTPGAGDELIQTATVRVTPRRPELFSIAPAWNASTNVLTFAVAGTTKDDLLVDFAVVDDGAPPLTSAVHTLTIDVRPVNQPPTLTVPRQLNVSTCTSGAATCAKLVRGLATNITAGGATELQQSLSASVAVPLEALPLFSVVPALQLNGDLSFTLQAGATTYGGAAVELRVTIRDDGGTADGGVDTTTLPLLLQIWPTIPPPSFSVGPALTVRQDAGRVDRSGWITSAARGSFTPSTLTWNATVSDATLFDVPPSFVGRGATADLTFTPSPARSGTATIFVTARDAETGQTTTSSGLITVTEFVRQPSAVHVSPVRFYRTEAAARRTVLQNLTAAPGSSIAATNVTCIVETVSVAPLFLGAPFMHSPTATLEATPNPAAVGSARCTVVVTAVGDSTGAAVTAQYTVTLMVEAPNQAPSFTLANRTVVVPQADSWYDEVGFASAITAGLASESSQTLRFEITCTNASLFAIAPRLSESSGALTFVPSMHLSGSTLCTVVLHDSGPGEAPNVNRSAPSEVVISVRHVNRAPTFKLRADAVLQQGTAGTTEFAGFVFDIDAGHVAEATQQVVVDDITSDASLFSAVPTLTLGGNRSATLRLGLRESVFGVVRFDVCFSDSGGTEFGGVDRTCASASVYVARVNRAPGATFDSQLVVPQTSAPFVAANWLRLVHAGAGDTDQSVTTAAIACDPSSAAVMTTTPLVNLSTGAVVVWPRHDAAGTANCTLSLRDSAEGIATFPVAFDVVRVNRAPTLSAALRSVTALEGEERRIAALRSVSPGPETWEAQQSVGLTVSVEPPTAALEFASYPVISNVDWQVTFTLRNGTTLRSVALVVTARDDGGTAHGGRDTSDPVTITVTVDLRPSRPDVYLRQPRVSVLEGAAAATFGGFVVGFAETRHVAAIECNAIQTPGVFASPPAVTGAGNLTFELLPDVHGTIPCLCTVRDTGSALTTALSFEITSVNVNDAPSFAYLGNISVEAGSTTAVQNWASRISVGRNEESVQTAVFVVAAQTGGASAVRRLSIDARTGDLEVVVAQTTTPATACYTVSLRDNGGVDFGGVDESPAVMLCVSVTVPIVPTPLLVIGSGDFAAAAVRGTRVVEVGWIQYAPRDAVVFATARNTSVATRVTVNISSGDLSVLVGAVGSTVIDVTAVRGGDVAVANCTFTVLPVTTAPVTTTTTSVAPPPPTTTAVAALVATVNVRPGRPRTVTLIDVATASGPFVVTTNVSTLVWASPPEVDAAGRLSLTAVPTVRSLTAAAVSVRTATGALVTMTTVWIVPATTLVRATLTQDVATFDAAAFRQRIALEAGVQPEQVVIVSVRAGSTVVDFYIDHDAWEPGSSADAIAPALAATLGDSTTATALALGSVGSGVVPNVDATTTPPATTTTAAATLTAQPQEHAADSTEEEPFYNNPFVIAGAAVVVVLVIAAVIVCVACCRRKAKAVEVDDADDFDDVADAAAGSPQWSPGRGHPMASLQTDDEPQLPVKRDRPARRHAQEEWVDVADEAPPRYQQRSRPQPTPAWMGQPATDRQRSQRYTAKGLY